VTQDRVLRKRNSFTGLIPKSNSKTPGVTVSQPENREKKREGNLAGFQNERESQNFRNSKNSESRFPNERGSRSASGSHDFTTMRDDGEFNSESEKYSPTKNITETMLSTDCLSCPKTLSRLLGLPIIMIRKVMSHFMKMVRATVETDPDYELLQRVKG